MDIIEKTEDFASEKMPPGSSNEKSREKRHRRIRGILLLIVAVSVTSCIIGFVIGRIVTEDHYTDYIVDTIQLSRADQEPAEAKTYFDLSGRVLYTDGTPYANSLVELRSKPRYTYSDALGHFRFDNVEPGMHTVNVVQNGVIKASCRINVEADASYTDSEIVQLDDGSFSIHISLDVSVLELTLTLENERIIPQLSDTPSEPQEDPLPENSELPVLPDQPDQPVTPEPPLLPEPPKNPGSAAPSGPPDRAPSADVADQTGNGNSWNQNTAVNIFGEREGNINTKTIDGQHVIAPGSSGMYLFRVKNIENYDINYTISLLDSDENQPSLPLKYRLKAGNVYIGSNQWLYAGDLPAAENTLVPGDSLYYKLEWKWDSVDDATDTEIGMQDGAPIYMLTIQINAQFK